MEPDTKQQDSKTQEGDDTFATDMLNDMYNS